MTMRAFFVILLAMFCVACSKADADKTSADLKTAANDVAHDPAVKQLGSDIKTDARQAGVELKKGAAKANVELGKAGSKAKVELAKAGDKAKEKAAEAKAKVHEKTAEARDHAAG